MSTLDLLCPLPDLRVLVTGGASGIGGAIARAFHEAGARVHVCDIDRSALDRLVAATPGVTGSMADASSAADVDRVFDDAQGALGGLDVLVNSVGIAGPSAPIDEIDASGWERTIAVNLHSQYYFARRAVPLLRQSRASPLLVGIGSLAGRAGGYAMRSPLACSQWAIVGLTKSLASELAPQGVRVNAILPGSAGDLRSQGDVAAMALFLCTPAARQVSGQVISVGGDEFLP